MSNNDSFQKAMPTLIGAAALVAFVWIIASAGSSGSSSSKPPGITSDAPGGMVEELIAKRDQCRSNVDQLQTLGVKLRDEDGTTEVQYDERVWAGFEHDDKIRQALLIYCARMPDTGAYTVVIRGLHDGRMMASVVDGNYFDN